MHGEDGPVKGILRQERREEVAAWGGMSRLRDTPGKRKAKNPWAFYPGDSNVFTSARDTG